MRIFTDFSDLYRFLLDFWCPRSSFLMTPTTRNTVFSFSCLSDFLDSFRRFLVDLGSFWHPKRSKSDSKNRCGFLSIFYRFLTTKLSSFWHLWVQTSMKNPRRFSDVEKITPGTNNYRILVPSDPQNHKKTTVKHWFS